MSRNSVHQVICGLADKAKSSPLSFYADIPISAFYALGMNLRSWYDLWNQWAINWNKQKKKEKGERWGRMGISEKDV